MKTLYLLACLLLTPAALGQLWQGMTVSTYGSEALATSALDTLAYGPAVQNGGLVPVPNRGIYSSANDLMSWLVFNQPPGSGCETTQGSASPPIEARAWAGHPNCVIILATSITVTAPDSYTNAKSFRDGLSIFMRAYSALLPFPSAVAYADRWYVAYRAESTLCVQ